MGRAPGTPPSADESSLQARWRSRIGLALFVLPLVVLIGAAQEPATPASSAPGPAVDSPLPKEDTLVPPPDISDSYPCTFCHDNEELKPDARRRPLPDHDSIVLKHADGMWCMDCHDLRDRDSLRLASGALITYDDSYRLCGQCHGEKYRDWLVGVHGRRTGDWNGKKTYMLCVNCHNPHQPLFKPMTPKPPPVPPSRPR